MSGQEKDWDKSKTRYYLDEFDSERIYDKNGPTQHRKTRRQIGPLALRMIRSKIERLFDKYQPTMPNGDLYTVSACMNEFYVDRKSSLLEAFDSLETKNDAMLEAFILTTADGWFLSKYGESDEGKVKDALRKRLERDSRFAPFLSSGTVKPKGHKAKDGGFWGLSVEYLKSHELDETGYRLPSTVPEANLQTVALKYTVTIDPVALQAEGRRRPNYGEKGQMEDMLEGVFTAAHGTLSLSSVYRIVHIRMGMEDHSVVHPTDEDGNPVEFAVDDTSAEEFALRTIEPEDSDEWVFDLLDQLLKIKEENGNPRQYVKARPRILEQMMTSKNPLIRQAALDLGYRPNKKKA